MQKTQDYLLAFFIFFCVTTISYSQATDIGKRNKEGTIFYKSGSKEIGKLSYNKTHLKIKFEDGSKKDIDINKVDKFGIYKKNKDSVYYTFVKSKRNAKSGKKYLCYLTFDGEKIKLFNEPIDTKMGALTISQPFYFIQKQGDRYAVRLLKLFKNGNTQIKEHFEDCPSLSEKIGEKGYRYKDIIEIVKYYEANCEAPESTNSAMLNEDGSPLSPEEKRAKLLSDREAKRDALLEKRKMALEERAQARQERLDSIKKARGN